MNSGSRAESALRQAIGHLLMPDAESYRKAGEHLAEAAGALRDERASGEVRACRGGLDALVRQTARLLHQGAALRLGCGALAFPVTAQYTSSGSHAMPSSPGHQWEA